MENLSKLIENLDEFDLNLKKKKGRKRTRQKKHFPYRLLCTIIGETNYLNQLSNLRNYQDEESIRKDLHELLSSNLEKFRQVLEGPDSQNKFNLEDLLEQYEPILKKLKKNIRTEQSNKSNRNQKSLTNFHKKHCENLYQKYVKIVRNMKWSLQYKDFFQNTLKTTPPLFLTHQLPKNKKAYVLIPEKNISLFLQITYYLMNHCNFKNQRNRSELTDNIRKRLAANRLNWKIQSFPNNELMIYSRKVLHNNFKSYCKDSIENYPIYTEQIMRDYANNLPHKFIRKLKKATNYAEKLDEYVLLNWFQCQIISRTVLRFEDNLLTQNYLNKTYRLPLSLEFIFKYSHEALHPSYLIINEEKYQEINEAKTTVNQLELIVNNYPISFVHFNEYGIKTEISKVSEPVFVIFIYCNSVISIENYVLQTSHSLQTYEYYCSMMPNYDILKNPNDVSELVKLCCDQAKNLDQITSDPRIRSVLKYKSSTSTFNFHNDKNLNLDTYKHVYGSDALNEIIKDAVIISNLNNYSLETSEISIRQFLEIGNVTDLYKFLVSDMETYCIYPESIEPIIDKTRITTFFEDCDNDSKFNSSSMKQLSLKKIHMNTGKFKIHVTAFENVKRSNIVKNINIKSDPQPFISANACDNNNFLPQHLALIKCNFFVDQEFLNLDQKIKIRNVDLLKLKSTNQILSIKDIFGELYEIAEPTHSHLKKQEFATSKLISLFQKICDLFCGLNILYTDKKLDADLFMKLWNLNKFWNMGFIVDNVDMENRLRQLLFEPELFSFANLMECSVVANTHFYKNYIDDLKKDREFKILYHVKKWKLPFFARLTSKKEIVRLESFNSSKNVWISECGKKLKERDFEIDHKWRNLPAAIELCRIPQYLSFRRTRTSPNQKFKLPEKNRIDSSLFGRKGIATKHLGNSIYVVQLEQQYLKLKLELGRDFLWAEPLHKTMEQMYQSVERNAKELKLNLCEEIRFDTHGHRYFVYNQINDVEDDYNFHQFSDSNLYHIMKDPNRNLFIFQDFLRATFSAAEVEHIYKSTVQLLSNNDSEKTTKPTVFHCCSFIWFNIGYKLTNYRIQIGQFIDSLFNLHISVINLNNLNLILEKLYGFVPDLSNFWKSMMDFFEIEKDPPKIKRLRSSFKIISSPISQKNIMDISSDEDISSHEEPDNEDEKIVIQNQNFKIMSVCENLKLNIKKKLSLSKYEIPKNVKQFFDQMRLLFEEKFSSSFDSNSSKILYLDQKSQKSANALFNEKFREFCLEKINQIDTKICQLSLGKLARLIISFDPKARIENTIEKNMEILCDCLKDVDCFQAVLKISDN
jgi:hypothetical protein